MIVMIDSLASLVAAGFLISDLHAGNYRLAIGDLVTLALLFGYGQLRQQMEGVTRRDQV